MVSTSHQLWLTPIQRKLLVASPLVVGFLVPPAILLGVQTVVGGVPLGAAVDDILRAQFAHGDNLFFVSLIGLIPFAVLTAKLQDYTTTRTRRAFFVMWLSGLLGILALMVPGHISVWYPLYGPGRISSTGAIAFLFIPVYCIVTLFVGLFIGQLVTRHRWFEAYAKGHCQRCGYNLKGNVTGVCPECDCDVKILEKGDCH